VLKLPLHKSGVQFEVLVCVCVCVCVSLDIYFSCSLSWVQYLDFDVQENRPFVSHFAR
jgi:hypothetical protein